VNEGIYGRLEPHGPDDVTVKVNIHPCANISDGLKARGMNNNIRNLNVRRNMFLRCNIVRIEEFAGTTISVAARKTAGS